MARAWLITSRGIAKKIRNTAQFSSKQINELSAEAKRECPCCNYVIDNSDVNIEWPGLPAGVKFDPSDLEIIEHLEAKLSIDNLKPHMFINEFIPTIDEEEGICYTHPANLPGIRKDGTCAHFFHKISNAYAIGARKRRKINTEDNNSITGEHVRWHKTGKTKPIIENGTQKGWKKIMVLYKSSKRGCKPDKANWVMHQYHLGTAEEEKDGEMVVSKVFYQLEKEKEKSELELELEELVKDGNTAVHAATVGPATPVTNAPQHPHQKKSNKFELQVPNVELLDAPDMQNQDEPTSPVVCLKNEGSSVWWESESQAVEEEGPKRKKQDQSLLCHEVLDSFILEPSLDFDFGGLDDMMLYGLSDLRCANLGSPPDLQISDLAFGSQESISAWLDRD